jgi:hypothetical protein
MFPGQALFMVEQPFPAHVHTESTPAQLEEWKKVQCIFEPNVTSYTCFVHYA